MLYFQSTELNPSDRVLRCEQNNINNCHRIMTDIVSNDMSQPANIYWQVKLFEICANFYSTLKSYHASTSTSVLDLPVHREGSNLTT